MNLDLPSDPPSALVVNGGVPFLPFTFASALGGVIAGVSIRAGGSSTGPYSQANMSYSVGDDPATVTANRKSLVESLGLDPARLTMGRQVHEGRVHVVDAHDIGRGGLDPDSAIADTDGLVTNQPDAVLAVLQADCVPVACYDPVRRVVGVVHSGWPGTVAKVATNLVTTMSERFDCDPGDLHAAIGPSIGPASYEVQEDVASKALAAFGSVNAGGLSGDDVIVHRADGTMAFDLWHANHLQLLAAGVAAERIEVTGLDSYVRNDLFFSHRRAAPCGRFACLIALRPT